MRIVSVLLWFLLTSSFCFAQAPDTLWTMTYGGGESDCGYSVEQTSDGGYIITGYTRSFGASSSDVYLIKTDSNGDTLWTKIFGGLYDDEGRSVAIDHNGGYVIAGLTESFGYGNEDVYLIKTDPSGDTIWTKTFGGSGNDEAWSIKQTSDSGYIIVGTTVSFGAGGSDVYVIKTDSNGDTLWTTTFGHWGNDEGHSAMETSDGGYIIAGLFWPIGSDADIYLIKTDSSGEMIWSNTFGGESYDIGRSVMQTFDSGYIIAGNARWLGQGYDDVYLIKTDSLGDTTWTRTFGGFYYDKGYSVQQTSDLGYIITGSTERAPALCNLFVIKTDSSGDTLWTKTIGGTYGEVGYSVKQTTDGGYIVAGITRSFGAGLRDVYLVRLKSGPEPIPTLSEWGMLIMALLLLAAGTVAVVRRKRAVSMVK